MSETLQRVRQLVRSGDYRISDHAHRRLTAAGVREDEVVAGLVEAEEVEDYPNFPKGPCVLVLQWDDDAIAYHALWGTPAKQARPAVPITAYRPDPSLWADGFRKRLGPDEKG